MTWKNRLFSIRFTVVMVFIIATIITASVALGLHYFFAKTLATTSAKQYSAQLAATSLKHLEALDQRAKTSVRSLSKNTGWLSDNWVDNIQVDSLIETILLNNHDFSAIYFGFGNGDFYELVNLEASSSIRKQIGAAHLDRFLKVTVTGVGDKRIKRTEFLDEQLIVRYVKEEPSDYDVRSRDWYNQARTYHVHKTKPYLFQHLQIPGQTYSSRIVGTNTVIAVDIALSTVSEYLTSLVHQSGSKKGQAFIYHQQGDIIAASRGAISREFPKVKPLTLTKAQQAIVRDVGKIRVSNEMDWAPLDFSISGSPRGYIVDQMKMVAQKLGLGIEFVNGWGWPELVEQFKQQHIDILTPVHQTGINREWGHFSESLLNIPMAVMTAPGKGHVTQLSQLNYQRVAIPKGWSIIEMIREAFPLINVIEVDDIDTAIKMVVNKEVSATIESEVILNYTAKMHHYHGIEIHPNVNIDPIDFDTHLRMVVAKQHQELVPLINYALANISDDEQHFLDAKWLDVQVANDVSYSSVVPYKRLLSLTAQENNLNKLHKIMLTHEGNSSAHYAYIAPILDDNEQVYFAIVMSVRDVVGESIDYVSKSLLITIAILLLLLPVSWLFASPIVAPIKRIAHANQLIKERKYDELVIGSTHIKELDNLANSLLSMANSIKQHEADQRALMDSFIQLIAQAIDDKSPYTGGHCNRVPELGILLAEQASQSQAAYFKDFALNTEEAKREFRIAAWLHDCGKITTPEHIVDKGSKLECIYNRIHEIRMRFEVLWRDAEIEYFTERLQHPAKEASLKQALTQKQAQLQDDFAFVASCNVGAEFMEEDKLARLAALSEITWQRYFDNQLGLSPAEENHIKASTTALPATEPLLADKAEHIIHRDQPIVYPSHLGIKIKPPEHKANLGELYNLSIGRGTLTAEDRFIINEHIISTIKMLDALPFPDELKNVPRFASTHHETLKGTGYPRKLAEADLTIADRVLVLADIFEALTAADRPYKKAKTLSLSLDILHKMCLDKHVDIEVFKLFLSSGVYLQYAEKFLAPWQIDEVDLSRYLDE